MELAWAITGSDVFRKEFSDKIALLKEAVLDRASVLDETYNKIIIVENDMRSLNRKLN